MEITITEQNFDEVLQNNAVVMVDFGATWCGPCKALAPVVEEIANEYEGRAAVCKADVEECSSIAARFRRSGKRLLYAFRYKFFTVYWVPQIRRK